MDRQLQSGALLAYPACCVEHHDLVDANFDCAFASTIVATVGKDASAVERALREDLEIVLPGDPTDGKNMRRTDELFPFVFHVACDSCLSSDTSPSAELNRGYGRLAEQYDRAFHHWYLEMAKISVQIARLIDEADDQNLRRGELTGPLKERLAELFTTRDRIYSKFF